MYQILSNISQLENIVFTLGLIMTFYAYFYSVYNIEGILLEGRDSKLFLELIRTLSLLSVFYN